MEENCCPLRSRSGFSTDCVTEVCAWWDDIMERCSVASLAFSASALAGLAYDMFEDEESDEEPDEKSELAS